MFNRISVTVNSCTEAPSTVIVYCNNVNNISDDRLVQILSLISESVDTVVSGLGQIQR